MESLGENVKTKKKTSSMSLELNGEVSLITTRNGKVVKREPIDSKLVLKVILTAIENGLRAIEEDECKHKYKNYCCVKCGEYIK